VGRNKNRLRTNASTNSNLVLEPSAGAENIQEVSIALPRLVLMTVLPRVLPTFREKFPDVRLHIEERSSSAATAVATGHVDIALYAGPDRDPDLTYQLLPPVPMIVASPRIYLWNTERISARALSRQPLVVYPKTSVLRDIMDRWFRKSRVKPKEIVMTVRDTETILKFVGLGLGHALVPSMGLRTSSDYMFHQVSATVDNYSPMLVYRSDDYHGLSKPAASLLETIEGLWPALARIWPTSE